MDNVDKVLGKNVTYPKYYSKEILAKETRFRNREKYNIQENSLPFVGYDVWHAYEFSVLLKSGFPLNAVLKLAYNANSPYLVESKSFKLYLNSYNMTHLETNSIEDAKIFIKAQIERDLIELLEEPNLKVELFFKNETSPLKAVKDFIYLEDELDLKTFKSLDIRENPSLLKQGQGTVLKIHSALLRSNCKITNQPDWGDVYIYMEGDAIPNLQSLGEYLVSFREEQHFHEEIVEMIYIRLLEIFQPKNLVVCALYTRRGGIDICPIRANHDFLLNYFKELIDIYTLTDKTLRQ